MADTELGIRGQAGVSNEAEDWDEDEEEEDYDDDEDIDAEAEEIARRLGAELWADISKANADRAADLAHSTDAVADVMTIDGGHEPVAHPSASRKEEAVIVTMKTILTFLETDPLAMSTLESTQLPNSNGDTVLAVLRRTVAAGIIAKDAAMSLSQTLVLLARSEVLFGTLRHSNASSIRLDIGKRKREETDEGMHQSDPRVFKRPYMMDYDLVNQVNESVRVITHALGSSPIHTLNPALVASIRLQLHRVFLFAVTSSAGGGHEMNALQEISGLIQVIGVLSGIQIGQPPDSHGGQPPQHTHAFPPNGTYPWLTSQTPGLTTDIGTAVYPCLIAGCRKTFSRLYSLRAHQRIHAAVRPFRCNSCPASFARNHDLKRHIKLHDKKAWKCGGCHKVFSRRDAIKRHKNGSKTRGPKSEACLEADILEIELNETERDESAVREERRAKLWNGMAVSQASGTLSPTVHRGYHEDIGLEEGEVQPAVIAGAQSAILSLHGLLQAHVGNALGAPAGHPLPPPADPTNGQATLASVIARAQMQNLPPKVPVSAAVSDQSIPRSDPSTAIQSPQTQELSLDPILMSAGPGEQANATTSLSMYGLSDEQTKLLEQAIASAASAALAQAEAEAALEEEEEGDYDQDDDDYDGSEDHMDTEQPS